MQGIRSRDVRERDASQVLLNAHGRDAKTVHRMVQAIEKGTSHAWCGGVCEDLEWALYHERHVGPIPDLPAKSDYHVFQVPKGNGKWRTIEAPCDELKAFQRALIPRIMAACLIHARCMGFMPGKSVVHHAMMHRNNRLILKMDIEDFFHSVPHKEILNVMDAVLTEGIRSNHVWTATMMGGLVTILARLPDGLTDCLRLPQGAPTSPIIANAAFYNVDCALTRVAKEHGATYSRYADDLVFSFPTEDEAGAMKVIAAVYAILKRHGYTPNAEKTRIMRVAKRAIVCGVWIHPGGALTVTREFRRKVRALRHLVEVKGRKDLEERYRGCLAFQSMVEDGS